MLTWNITSIKVVHPSQITLTVFHCNSNYTKTDQNEHWLIINKFFRLTSGSL